MIPVFNYLARTLTPSPFLDEVGEAARMRGIRSRTPIAYGRAARRYRQVGHGAPPASDRMRDVFAGPGPLDLVLFKSLHNRRRRNIDR